MPTNFLLKIFFFTALSFCAISMDASLLVGFGQLACLVSCILMGIANMVAFSIMLLAKRLKGWLIRNAFTIIVVECYVLSLYSNVNIYPPTFCLIVLLPISRFPDIYKRNIPAFSISIPAFRMWAVAAFCILYVALFSLFHVDIENLGGGYTYHIEKGYVEKTEILPRHITNAAHNERYIILEQWLSSKSYEEDTLKYDTLKYDKMNYGDYYYIIDKKDNTIIGPMLDREFQDVCRNKGIEIRFPPRENGRMFHDN